MSKPLIILDRDGVINQDSDDYIKSADEWIAINSSLAAIAKLTAAGYNIAVATNQSGLSRGFFSLNTLTEIHTKMLKNIEDMGGCINAIEFCPDHPDQAGPNRKPAPGMLLKLFQQFGVKAENTWFVGDSISDINCALNAGCKPALVLTGKGLKAQQSGQLDSEIPQFKDLSAFVDDLLAGA